MKKLDVPKMRGKETVLFFQPSDHQITNDKQARSRSTSRQLLCEISKNKSICCPCSGITKKNVFPPCLTSRRKSNFFGLSNLQNTNEEPARRESTSKPLFGDINQIETVPCIKKQEKNISRDIFCEQNCEQKVPK